MRAAFRFALALPLTLGACSLTSDLDPLRGPDAGTDATPDVVVPQKGFTLDVAPSYVISDPGETHAVTVTLTRAPGFTDPVNVALNAPPPDAGISQQTSVLFTDQASAPMTFKVDGKATGTGSPYQIEVAGQSGIYTSKANFFLHIGTLLATSTSIVTNVTVKLPTYATSVDVKLWGGGGGGGSYDGTCNPSSGGAGGGGGFLSATIPVAPSSVLELVVGGGGTTKNGSGAGGGGYSAVRVGTTPIAIAGGGGGGGRNACAATSGSTEGMPGHATTTPFNSCTGKNGTSTAGGAGGGNGGAGMQLTGGNAASGTVKGGVPGGGLGGAGGGGGAGAYGGGAGGTCNAGTNPGGGGGGSGFAPTNATAVSIVAGSGTAPGAASDPDNGGAGVGGTEGAYPGNNPTLGANGKVIVRLTKTK